MIDFQRELDLLLRDRSKLVDLLGLAKASLGKAPTDLVYVGPSVIAQYYWCAMKAFFTAQLDELGSFVQLLTAQLTNAHRLGALQSVPIENEKILEVSSNVKIGDVWSLFYENRAYAMRSSISHQQIMQVIEKTSSKLPPTTRGLLFEMLYAEKYPTMTWGFGWGEFIVVGEPDGITENFIYEYKTTRVPYYMKPVAFAQANLYAEFFKRDSLRIQILSVNDKTTSTWQVAAESENAQVTLRRFENVVIGATPQPPKSWKCKRCLFAVRCPICQQYSQQLPLWRDDPT